MVPATAAGAADLSDLLEESGEASYEAEQVITCSTPDGVRDAVIALTQSGGEIHIGASVDPEVEVASGDGGWTLVRGGSVVSSVNLQATTSASGSRYTVDDGSVTEYLGREATLYRMVDEGTLRAELVLDEEVGALLRVTTFTADGRVYCERRFITFEPGDPAAEADPVEPDADPDVPVVETSLPEELGAFERLDVYGDEAGFLFAYYSDGFFSFAVFETPSVVTLDDPSVATVNDRPYTRVFGPGQVTYVWETLRGGMALVGDLPPDMHQTVLSGLPAPADPGLFRRLWRNLFG
jgi:hypothetical protein